MCRNIRTLYNFDPPATESEIRAACLQFVRKLSGFNRPSAANEAAFQHAVERTTHIARELIGTLVTHAAPKNRDEETRRKKEKAAQRFSQPRALENENVGS